jgi:hypothetical protein
MDVTGLLEPMILRPQDNNATQSRMLLCTSLASGSMETSHFILQEPGLPTPDGTPRAEYHPRRGRGK